MRWGRFVRVARGRAGRIVRQVPGLRAPMEQRPDPREPLVAEICAKIAADDLDAAHRLAESAWRRRPEHVQLQDLLIAARHQRGDSESALALCRQNATRRIRWLERHRVRLRAPRRLAPEQRILVSGFYKSGSSAVFEYLRGFDGVGRWTPAGEMRLVKAPGGFADLAARDAGQAGLGPADLVDFYLHLTGWRAVSVAPGAYHIWDVQNRHASGMFGQRPAFGYLRVCLETFVNLASPGGVGATGGDLERLFRATAQRALDAAATDLGTDTLVIDQAVNAWRLPISRFLPPSTFVIVHRDPRDQYADIRATQRQPGRRAMPAAEFARKYRARMRKVEEDVVRMAQKYGHRSLRTSFEDFVLDHQATAQLLADSLGLSGRRHLGGRARSERGHYRPERGRAGIGQHRTGLHEPDNATLVDELPEFLDKRVGSW